MILAFRTALFLFFAGIASAEGQADSELYSGLAEQARETAAMARRTADGERENARRARENAENWRELAQEARETGQEENARNAEERASGAQDDASEADVAAAKAEQRAEIAEREAQRFDEKAGQEGDEEAREAHEAVLTDPNTIFHRIYIIGSSKDAAEAEVRVGKKNEIQQALEGSGNEADGSSSTLLTTPRREKIRTILELLQGVAVPGNEVTIYYTGHGGGGPFWGGKDLDEEENDKYEEHININEGQSLRDDQLATWLEGFAPGVSITLLLDTCFGGGFTGGSQDVQENNSVNVIGNGTFCPTSGDSTLTKYAVRGIDGTADYNGDGIVSAVELENFLSTEGWDMRPPYDDSRDTSVREELDKWWNNADAMGPDGEVEAVDGLNLGALEGTSADLGTAYWGATQSTDCNQAGFGTPMFLKTDLSYYLGTTEPSSRSLPNGSGDDGTSSAWDDYRVGSNSAAAWVDGRDQEVFGFGGEPSDSPVQARFDPYVYLYLPLQADFGISTWPNHDSTYWDVGSGQGPFKGVISSSGSSASNGLQLQGRSYGSINYQTPPLGSSGELQPYVNQQLDIGGTSFTSLMFDYQDRGRITSELGFMGITAYENNWCRVVLTPTDPNYKRTGRHEGGSWGQPVDDQWAIKRVGFTDDEESAWNLLPENSSSVIVAVIDSGLDWHHKEINHQNIWRNEEEIPDNGIDDDGNGYVDDLIGWNFFARNNKPWDFDGHGTVVAGIIAAAQNNDSGIAGINPQARIMVLKGVNNFGTTRASYIAEAIVYAVDNGARVVNISVGGPHTSIMEQAAIDYAHENDVLVFAAAGNDGVELDDFGPGGADNLLTVGATHVNDRAAPFSNFGDQVDLVAPGVEVLSLRARYTDTNYRAANEEYVVGTNYVGEDKRYLHVSGTSFSTPIVAATASLLFAKNPQLTAAQAKDILLQTAEDIGFPGNDKHTGHGMVDARAALSVAPGFSITAAISALEPVPADAPSLIRVIGTIDASNFKRAWLQIGPGENPGGWRYVGQKRKYPITDGTLGMIPIREFRGSELWQVVINVEHQNGVIKRAVYPIKIR